MTFWQFLDKRWPNERSFVTILLMLMIWGLLQMAYKNPALWDVEVFKVIIQAVVLTGFLNMLMAFYFAANKGDETKSENTAKAFDAITATAQAGAAPNDDAPGHAAQQVAEAAAHEADEIQGKT